MMLREDVMGFVVRSRFGQNVEEERASLFHASREFKNGKNSITKLKVNGQVIENPSIIDTEVTSFFRALFN